MKRRARGFTVDKRVLRTHTSRICVNICSCPYYELSCGIWMSMGLAIHTLHPSKWQYLLRSPLSRCLLRPRHVEVLTGISNVCTCTSRARIRESHTVIPTEDERARGTSSGSNESFCSFTSRWAHCETTSSCWVCNTKVIVMRSFRVDSTYWLIESRWTSFSDFSRSYSRFTRVRWRVQAELNPRSGRIGVMA